MLLGEGCVSTQNSTGDKALTEQLSDWPVGKNKANVIGFTYVYITSKLILLNHPK